MGYARVSTVAQNLDRQLEALGEVDKLYVEKRSGSSRKRPELEKCLDFLREGDTLRVKSVDRLARSTRDLLNILSDLDAKGVKVEFIDSPELSTNTSMGQLVITLLGAIAQFELDLMHERQCEGIAIAKAKGKYQRPNALTPEQIEEARRRIADGVPKAKVARDLGVSRSTLYVALDGKGSYATKEAAQEALAS
ncbi:recombinase family protein [Candidatus Collinsella stercoripullorum]|uniref:recombinase family protein n=1 Tax=Candidatus Collinsella stercoripullorum TaxID=2838522 RepID=UPI0022DFE316|nr:recombinase family protein [Candidatus Collinsella stercoripullorum]